MSNLVKIILSLVCVIALLGAQSPQEPALQDLLAPHAYPIALENGELSGAGADLLIAEAGKAQFLAIGEEHNHRYIPAITTALFKTLHERHGYNYLADEQDPAMMRLVSTLPARGDRRQVESLARTYKHGFTFISDQELRMLADIAAMSDGQGRPIWGCEQAFGVTHILDQLEPHAPNDAARDLLRELREEARQAEAVRDLRNGHYIAREGIGQRLAPLANAFIGSNETARFLAEAPITSNRIYSYYHNGTRQAFPGFYSNSKVREDYMKEVCLSEYRNAHRNDGQPPRVILKFGHWHLYDGWNSNNITTLGNFFSSIARLNDAAYVSVAMFPASFEGNPIWDIGRLGYLRVFKDVVPPDEWRLVDLRALREGPALRRIRATIADLDPAMKTELNRLLYGFDFALFLGPHAPATFEVAQVPY